MISDGLELNNDLDPAKPLEHHPHLYVKYA